MFSKIQPSEPIFGWWGGEGGHIYGALIFGMLIIIIIIINLFRVDEYKNLQ